MTGPRLPSVRISADKLPMNVDQFRLPLQRPLRTPILPAPQARSARRCETRRPAGTTKPHDPPRNRLSSARVCRPVQLNRSCRNPHSPPTQVGECTTSSTRARTRMNQQKRTVRDESDRPRLDLGRAPARKQWLSARVGIMRVSDDLAGWGSDQPTMRLPAGCSRSCTARTSTARETPQRPESPPSWMPAQPLG